MQPSPSKKARFDPALETPQTPLFVISFLSSLVNSSSSSSKTSFFLSSPPIAQPINNLLSSSSRLLLRHASVIQQSQPTVQTVRQSSLIESEGLLNLLLAACQRAEKETKAERGDNTSF